MATFKENLELKLPSRQEVISVLSVIVFIVFTWTLYRMFFQVPSLLFYMRVWDVLIISSYVLMFALFESAVVLGLLLIFSLVFPTKYFKDKFVAQGSTIVLMISMGAVALQRKMKIMYRLDGWELILYPFVILAVIVFVIFTASYIYDRFNLLPRIINTVAERMIVFVVLYVPLSILGLLVVFVRNII
ncbi:hypothetical protein ACFLV7_04390 [Chloroflexota bacterium]